MHPFGFYVLWFHRWGRNGQKIAIFSAEKMGFLFALPMAFPIFMWYYVRESLTFLECQEERLIWEESFMKKLFSILLAIALLATTVLPAVAVADETLANEVQVSPILSVKQTKTTIAEKFIYDENGEVVETIPYTRYTWDECAVDFMVYGNAYYDTLWILPDAVAKETGRKLDLTIQDNQYEQPWEVGGTYTVTVGLFDPELQEQVWEQNLQVTVVAYELPTVELELADTNVTALNFGSYVAKDYSWDEEKQEEIVSEEYIRYPWYQYCKVEVTLGGETQTVSLENLCDIVRNQEEYTDIAKYISGGIEDSQSAETPWEVGGTYDARYYIFDMEENAELWSVDLKVTLTEPEVDIQISEIVVDELFGHTYEDEEGNAVTIYEWSNVGVVDAVVDGVEYSGMTLDEFRWMLNEKYGEVWISSRFVVEYDEENPEEYFDPNDQREHPWQVGETYPCQITLQTEDMFLFSDTVDVKLCETKIDSVIANPVECYAHEGGQLDLLFKYKDGTTGPCNMYWYPVDGWPEEPGEYTVKIIVGDIFEVEVPVTVLPAPTSGKLGENITWEYDATTNTITISGTGNTYFTDITIDEDSDEFNEFIASWRNLLMYYMPESIVIEEGITGLTPGLLMEAPSVENLTLPNSLKKMPFLFLGYNGFWEGENSGFDKDFTGVQTFVLPQNITNWDELFFFACWGVEDIYLPAGLTSVNLDNLIYSAWFREEQMEMDPVTTTIHFAGTEEQWNTIKFHVPEVTAEYIETQTIGLTLEEAMAYLESFEIVFEDPADSYVEKEVEEDTEEEPKDEIIVENGTVTIPDSVVDIVEGEDVVIEIVLPTAPGEDEDSGADDNQGAEGDEVAPAPKVESVVIGAATVEKIVNANTSVQIKLPEMTVSFDADAFNSIGEQAEDKDVTIVATEINKEKLNKEQLGALEEKEVHTVLNLEAHAGETKITEFGGGKVTVSVPFVLPEGKTADDFYVAYVADDGAVTKMPTTFADNYLRFETTHFSHYAVVENVTPPTGDNPPTGDVNVMLFALLVVASVAGMAVCFSKRRAF